MKFAKRLLALSGKNQNGSNIGQGVPKAKQRTEGWKNLRHGWQKVSWMRRKWNGSSIFTHLGTGINVKAFLGSPNPIKCYLLLLHLIPCHRKYGQSEYRDVIVYWVMLHLINLSIMCCAFVALILLVTVFSKER